jgi:ribonucleoside-diphosphate reductase alpha chain
MERALKQKINGKDVINDIEYYERLHDIESGKNIEHGTMPKPDCPECGSKLEHEGGCVVCRSCGYSKCG